MEGFRSSKHPFILRQWLVHTPLRSPRSSPSPFSSVSLSASEQKHAAHPAPHDTPAKSSLPAPRLVSFTPKSIPRTCINSPSFTLMASGRTNRQANASPFYRYPILPRRLPNTLMHSNKSERANILQTRSATIWLFPPAQIWSDSGNTLCCFNGVSKGKRRRTIFI